MEIKLTDEEILFSIELQEQFSIVFVPVPFFLLRIKPINDLNTYRLMTVVKGMREDEGFIQASGMRPERLAFVLLQAADFAIWKRSVAMRFQWVLQFIALFFLFKVIWLWLG